MPNADLGHVASQALVVGFWLVFVGSVLGKLDGWSRWSSLASALPLPRPIAATVRVLLPLVEATVAVLLLLAPAAGLVAAGALLGVFAVAVVVFARRIGPAECGCFGALTPTKLGTGLAVRDGILAALAAAGVVVTVAAEAPRPPLPALALGLCIGFCIVLVLEYARLTRARSAAFGGDR